MSLREIKEEIKSFFKFYVKCLEEKKLEKLDAEMLEYLEDTECWEKVEQMLLSERGQRVLKRLQKEAEEELYDERGDEFRQRIENFVLKEKERINNELNKRREELSSYRNELKEVFDEYELKPTEIIKSMDYSLDRKERLIDIRNRLSEK